MTLKSGHFRWEKKSNNNILFKCKLNQMVLAKNNSAFFLISGFISSPPSYICISHSLSILFNKLFFVYFVVCCIALYFQTYKGKWLFLETLLLYSLCCFSVYHPMGHFLFSRFPVQSLLFTPKSRATWYSTLQPMLKIGRA